MSDHSIFAPSGYHQLIHCEGSVMMQAMHPDTGYSEASIEGTAAHWLGETAMPYKANGSWYPGTMKQVGSKSPAGVIITQQMADGAGQWVDHVAAILDANGPKAELNIEQRVDIPAIHELAYGTPDTDIWIPWRKELHIIDFKFGFGLHEAVEHPQCVGYAKGRIDRLREHTVGLQDEHITVFITIIQPRAFHPMGAVRTWKCKGSDLRGMINLLNSQAHASMEANPKCRTGPGCTHCTARHACVANQQRAYAAAQYISEATSVELSGAALGLELKILADAKAALKSRMTGLEEQAFAELLNGKEVPGQQLGRGRGSWEWDKPVDEVIAMGEMMGVDLRKPAQVITPTQAKNLVDESVISAYTQKYSGKQRLEPVNETLAQQVFAQ